MTRNDPPSAAHTPRAAPVRVLCAGIAVQDFIFRVEGFPTPGTKTRMLDFVTTGGGCAANAAIAIARLGGRARFCGPLGDDEMSGRILDGLVREGVDIAAVVRVPGAVASISGIFIDTVGERLLTTRREQGLAPARPADLDGLLAGVDAVLADNHFADFVLPIARAAQRRGIPVVLDIDKAAAPADPLLACATHAIFSVEALRGTAGIADARAALACAAGFCRGFVAATDGENGVLWHHGGEVRQLPAFAIEAVDTLAAGDVFHGAFTLALAEGRGLPECLRFASAAAALKCTRFGGIVGSPARAQVDRMLQESGQQAAD